MLLLCIIYVGGLDFTRAGVCACLFWHGLDLQGNGPLTHLILHLHISFTVLGRQMGFFLW